jgi:hypothetical protein
MFLHGAKLNVDDSFIIELVLIESPQNNNTLFNVHRHDEIGNIYYGQKLIMITTLLIDNHSVNWSQHVKYLCVTIGRRLNFGQPISDITRKVN